MSDIEELYQRYNGDGFQIDIVVGTLSICSPGSLTWDDPEIARPVGQDVRLFPQGNGG